MPDSYNDREAPNEAPAQESVGPTETRQSVTFPQTPRGTRWRASDALATKIQKDDA